MDRSTERVRPTDAVAVRQDGEERLRKAWSVLSMHAMRARSGTEFAFVRRIERARRHSVHSEPSSHSDSRAEFLLCQEKKLSRWDPWIRPKCPFKSSGLSNQAFPFEPGGSPNKRTFDDARAAHVHDVRLLPRALRARVAVWTVPRGRGTCEA